MKESLIKIYKGKYAFSRQITLFSLCGIVGLFDAYFVINGNDTLILWEKFAYFMLWVLFTFFMIGYETKFLHEREFPDIDFSSFKIASNRILVWIFLAGIPLISAKFYPELVVPALLIELFLAVPFTTIQAGFSYNFNSKEAFSLLKKISIRNYIVLTSTRLWYIICAYSLVFLIVFLIFFIGGIIFALIHGGSAYDIAFDITYNRIIIGKLSSFVTEVLLTYFLTISTLMWDYKLITTYEREV